MKHSVYSGFSTRDGERLFRKNTLTVPQLKILRVDNNTNYYENGNGVLENNNYNKLISFLHILIIFYFNHKVLTSIISQYIIQGVWN